MNTRIDLPTREGYDQWAATYDTDGNPLVALEEPLVDQLLGDVHNLSILDLGCGTGRHALRLAAAGAQVHAIDFSQAMLDQARQKPGAQQVTFQSHDLATPLPFTAQSFDRVVCGLVLEHIPDLGHFFREMRRVLRPTSLAVVSAMHPAMMLKGVTARFHDAQAGHEIRPQSHPHQLSDFIMAALSAGFTPDHLSEHAVDESLASRLPRARRYLGWPMLFLMRLHPRAQ
jgi:ubiquinone/menaquinone biosynthesis C-methylase UbiE